MLDLSVGTSDNAQSSTYFLIAKKSTTNDITFYSSTNEKLVTGYIDNNWHHYVWCVSSTGAWTIFVDGVSITISPAITEGLPDVPASGSFQYYISRDPESTSF